ncbi:MAG: trigger factor [Candidatus Protochlamydia sp.]|nr:trigger factor [Candidatus Protochlamydia sp.]
MSNEETGAEQNTASNDHITVHVFRKPNCLIKFDITVKPEAVEAAYHSAVKTVKKEVNIPGFRKGKAPDNFVLEKYASVIQKEFVDIALKTAFNESIQLTHLHPLKDGLVKRPLVHECSREKGAHFVLEFEGRPSVPSVKAEDLQLKKINSVQSTDEERQNAMDQVLMQFMTYEPIEGRGVEENDFIDVDVTLLEEPPREIIQNQRTQVNKKGLPSWMGEKVIGLKAGEHSEGLTQPNEENPNPEFKSVPYRITVKSIWKGTPPELNDDLAKKVGLSNMDELYNKINSRLESELEDDAYRRQIHELEEKLLEKYPIDLPRTYIEARNNSHMENYLKQLEAGHVSPQAKDYSELQKMIEATTVRNLMLHFLYHQIASENDITVTNDEITQELSKQISLLPSGRSQIDINGEKEKLHDQVYHLALDRKVKQHLLDRAQWV